MIDRDPEKERGGENEIMVTRKVEINACILIVYARVAFSSY